jgi:hypothetical protein
MMISDRAGIISSVVYGPDHRTRIVPDTQSVLFTTYAPPGITHQSVYDHLHHIRDSILVFAPQAEVEMLNVYGTE